MQEISPIKTRILQYLKYKRVSEYAFYKNSGVSRSTLKQNTGISEDNIAKFLIFAQDISPNWLLTGEGEMLNTEIPKDPKDAEIIELQKFKIESLENEIKKLKAQNN